MQHYEYPLNPDWSTDEIVCVIQLFNAVEQAYESSVDVQQLHRLYAEFKRIVTSIGEEKRLDKAFASSSGYSLYRVVKAMRQQMTEFPSKKKLTMKQ